MDGQHDFDFVIIGSGPAGQKAAVQAAKAGLRTAVVEQAREVGGACVHQGTIPSKALREHALRLTQFRRRAEQFSLSVREDATVPALIGELSDILDAHDRYMTEQMARNGITLVHGRARFTASHEVTVTRPGGRREVLRAERFLIATGSVPRVPPDVPIDHEHILDSDSILSMAYLPESLTVLGGGVIASEYASVFATLGVKVTMVDKWPRPLGFLDPELTDRFLEVFGEDGGSFIGGVDIADVAFDGVSTVETRLADGQVVRSEKMLCALGRVSRLDGLAVDVAGVEVSERGLVVVDANLRTSAGHVWAAGDVIGPPSLASASMEQGRRAACHALGLPTEGLPEIIPAGIYAVPEMSMVGESEEQVRAAHGDALVGRAEFREIARGQISGLQNGLLKMVAYPDGTLAGVHIVGDGATELVHIGQMGLLQGCHVRLFVDNVFNFPTLAEAYRVAALQIVGALRRRETEAPGAAAAG